MSTTVHGPIPAGLDPGFDHLTRAVKRDIRDVTSSGLYYVTPEVCRELKHVDNGVNHIRLDHDFLRNSAWNKICNPATTSWHKEGSIDVLHTARGHLHNVKDHMDVKKIHSGMDNQARQAHHLTIQDIRAVQADMRPYAHESVFRIKEYCNHVGVTDRYTGYRNNLTRGNQDPVVLAFSWLDNPTYKPHFTNIRVKNTSGTYNKDLCKAPIDKKITTGHEAQGANASGQSANAFLQPERSIQEQCGINTVFPGTTEYTDRYRTPDRGVRDPDYIINPLPNYNVDGRTLAKPAYYRPISEYTARYEWPDGNKITKFPWLRK